MPLIDTILVSGHGSSLGEDFYLRLIETVRKKLPLYKLEKYPFSAQKH